MSCLCTKAHLVFHRCLYNKYLTNEDIVSSKDLSWYFIDKYLYAPANLQFTHLDDIGGIQAPLIAECHSLLGLGHCTVIFILKLLFIVVCFQAF